MFSAARRAGITQHRLGVQRDRARAAVRHPAAVRAGRRGVPAAAGVDVLAGARPSRRTMAGQLCRWDPELKMIGLRFSNVMDPRTTRRSRPSRTTRRCGSGTCGATSTPATAPRPSAWRWSRRHRLRGLHHRQRRHGDERPNAELLAECFPAWRCAARSARTRRCCRSTRPAGCWATSRSTAGATRCFRTAAPDGYAGRCRRGAIRGPRRGRLRPASSTSRWTRWRSAGRARAARRARRRRPAARSAPSRRSRRCGSRRS